jgi:hypothetical protein
VKGEERKKKKPAAPPQELIAIETHFSETLTQAPS